MIQSANKGDIMRRKTLENALTTTLDAAARAADARESRRINNELKERQRIQNLRQVITDFNSKLQKDERAQKGLRAVIDARKDISFPGKPIRNFGTLFVCFTESGIQFLEKYNANSGLMVQPFYRYRLLGMPNDMNMGFLFPKKSFPNSNALHKELTQVLSGKPL